MKQYIFFSSNKRRAAACTGRVRGVLLLLVLAMSVIVPMGSTAQNLGTPEPIVTTGVTEPSVVEPAVAPPPTAEPVVIPTLPPPAMPTAVPTEVPPTAVPTVPVIAVPTATMAPTPAPTVAPTSTPSPMPTPTEVVWINTDSLAIVDAGVAGPLAPGQARQVVIRYQVTTPRVSTTVYAELRGDVAGWTISSPVLADQDGIATTATWIEAATVSPGTSFGLPILITAPVDVTVNQTVELRLWSMAATAKGAENGVMKPVVANIGATVLAPEPTAAPVVRQPLARTSTTTESKNSVQVPDAVAAASPMASPVAELAHLQPMSMVALTSVEGACKEIPSVAPAILTIECDPGIDDTKAPFDLSGLKLTPDWSYSIVEKDTGWSRDESVPGVSDASIQQPKITIRLKADSPSASSTVSVEFWAVPNKPKETTFHFRFGTTIVLPPAAYHLDLTCAPAMTELNLSQEALISCDIKGKEGLPQDVQLTNVTLGSPSGVSVTWIEPTNGSGLSIAPNVPVTKTSDPYPFSFILTRTACPGIDDSQSVNVSTTFSYVDSKTSQIVSTTGPSTQIELSTTPAAPSASIEDFFFTPITWNGISWGTTTGVAQITVKPAGGCGGTAERNITIALADGYVDPGLHSTVENVSVDGPGVILGTTRGDPSGPITVATVNNDLSTAGGTVDVTFQLTPDNTLGADIYEIPVEITVVIAD